MTDKSCRIFVIENEGLPLFHLTNGEISYILGVRERSDVLEQLYFGRSIRHQDDLSWLQTRAARHGAVLYDPDRLTSLDSIRLEYPVFGSTDFREEAVSVRYPAGDRISHFRYASHEIREGKAAIQGLPASFVREGQEGLSLEITLRDDYSGLELLLRYSIFAGLGLIARSARFTQTGEETLYLDRAMSLSLDLPMSNYELLSSHGTWAREMQMERRPLIHGIQEVASRRGVSSAQHNPFFALVSPETTEAKGAVYGFNLLYSGNFSNRIEVDSLDMTRVLVGINPQGFSWEMGPGEVFETPEAVAVYSEEGLNGMSRIFHDFYRMHVIRSPWRDKTRPVLMNNWEGTYFNIDEESIVEMAAVAKSVGVELFVLDDGWFGRRDDDTTSLGDWFADKRKLPNGIEGLADRIHDLGLLFGLWFEPEMVSPGTRIWNDHKDWIIHVPGKNISAGRHQYVLDLGREEVVDDLFGQISTVLRKAKVDYVKWDMNRFLTEVMSQALPPERQGETSHRFVLGVYELYERLIQAFPDILFESCSSGGARFDAGMLYYAPQAWASDNSDAVARLNIQYGTSYAYPIQSIGAHVSAVPNHQTGRWSSLAMRTAVASFGTFGYELDPRQLSAEDREQIKEDIAAYKSMQPLVAEGDFYRLSSPFESEFTSWMLVSKDRSEAVMAVYLRLNDANPAVPRFYPQGLDPEMLYDVTGPAQSDVPRYGDSLMHAGISLLGNENDSRFRPRGHMSDFTPFVIYMRSAED